MKGVDGKLLDLGHPDFKPKETLESMAQRVGSFLDDVIHPLLATDSEDETAIAVVSHGVILAFLWRALLQRFGARSVAISPKVSGLSGSRPLEYLPSWTNTGYLELDIKLATARPGPDGLPILAVSPTPPKLNDYQMLIKTVNCTDHLKTLKRTRGGLGSSPFDAKQKNLEAFVKKPRIDEQNPKLH